MDSSSASPLLAPQPGGQQSKKQKEKEEEGGGGQALTKEEEEKADSEEAKDSSLSLYPKQQQTQGGGFQFVSVSPTKKQIIDQNVLNHIKKIQQNDLVSWKGMTVDFISRPGVSNTWSNKKMQKQLEYFKIEEERFKVMLEGILKLKEMEEERLHSAFNQGSIQMPNQAGANINQQQHMLNLRGAEYIQFKQLKDPQLLNREGNILAYQKAQYLDQPHDLLFKLIKTDGKLIKTVLEYNGFQQTEGHDWNLMWICQSAKPYMYDNLNDSQKINHFPNSFELTRKDRLCSNIVKMQDRFSKEEFDIIPDTYNLPDEFPDFYSAFHKRRQAKKHNFWIIKPTNMSQGKGIYIIDEISEVPIDEQCCVSEYIQNPFLINGLKFDLRLYVLVTSFDPLRVYIYNEGLGRFASEPYNIDQCKKNKFANLTNYSINKKNEKFVQNNNAEQDDLGHKWSLGALSKHLESVGVDMNLLWSKIYDVVLKGFLSIEPHVFQALKKSGSGNGLKSNCFELLGYDILIDSDLKPWLMEVNLSPSLATDSPLDLKIKSSLFVDTLNLVGLKRFDRRRDNLVKMKNRVKNIMRAKSYQSRQNNPASQSKAEDSKKKTPFGESKHDPFTINKAFLERIQNLPTKTREFLRETLHENIRRSNFIRIYPTKTSDIYDKYLQQPRPNNKQLFKLLFCDELLYLPQNHQTGETNKYQQQHHHAKEEKELPVIKLQSNSPSKNPSHQHNLSSQEFKFQQNPSTKKPADPSKTDPGPSAKPHQQVDRIQQEKQLNPKLAQQNKTIQNPQFSRVSSAKLKVQEDQQPVDSRGEIGSKTIGGSGFQIAQKTQNSQQPSQNTTMMQLPTSNNDKLLITGDDVLIEYVSRLMIALKSIKEIAIKPQWKVAIEKFIKHYVWHSSDTRRAENNKLWQRLESRLIEMKERRKRLLKSMYKKELGKMSMAEFEMEYDNKEQQKNVIIWGFSAAQLEEMLRTSTKNVAYEVISCLIDSNGRGVLTEIIKWLTTNQQSSNVQGDGKSILDHPRKATQVRDTDEDPESYLGSSQTSNTSQNSTSVRIKIRKNSIDPHGKMRANIQKSLQNQTMGNGTSENTKTKELYKQRSENIGDTAYSIVAKQNQTTYRIKSPEAKKSNNCLHQGIVTTNSESAGKGFQSSTADFKPPSKFEQTATNISLIAITEPSDPKERSTTSTAEHYAQSQVFSPLMKEQNQQVKHSQRQANYIQMISTGAAVERRQKEELEPSAMLEKMQTPIILDNGSASADFSPLRNKLKLQQKTQSVKETTQPQNKLADKSDISSCFSKDESEDEASTTQKTFQPVGSKKQSVPIEESSAQAEEEEEKYTAMHTNHRNLDSPGRPKTQNLVNSSQSPGKFQDNSKLYKGGAAMISSKFKGKNGGNEDGDQESKLSITKKEEMSNNLDNSHYYKTYIQEVSNKQEHQGGGSAMKPINKGSITGISFNSEKRIAKEAPESANTTSLSTQHQLKDGSPKKSVKAGRKTYSSVKREIGDLKKNSNNRLQKLFKGATGTGTIQTTQSAGLPPK